MGTRFDIVFSGLEDSYADAVFWEISGEVQRLEDKLSRFLPESKISEINQNASKGEVIVDDEIWDILIKCRDYNTLTLGKFDITLLPLQQFWQKKQMNGFDSNRVSTDEVTNILDKTGMKHIIMNPDNNSIRFDCNGINIDLGGFGKGYVMDRLYFLIKKAKVDNALLSFGESSVIAVGHHPYGAYWKVGIRDLFKSGTSIIDFNIKNKSLSTSGATINKETKEPFMPAHIIDPKTGLPVQDIKTISVTSVSALEAEILSTALLVSEEQDIRELMINFKGCNAVAVNYIDGKGVIKYLK